MVLPSARCACSTGTAACGRAGALFAAPCTALSAAMRLCSAASSSPCSFFTLTSASRARFSLFSLHRCDVSS
eukprot:4060117-Pleurochrysis_carterae.AAC.1